MTGFATAVALVLQLAGTFAVWNWSRQFRSVSWLFLGCIGLAASATVLMLSGVPWSRRVVTGMLACYVLAALAWAWLVDGLAPSRWSNGELVLALGGAALLIGSA